MLGWILTCPAAIQEVAMAQVATPAPAAPSEPDQPRPARLRSEAERAEKYREMAKEFYGAGNLGGAIEMLRASLENTPLKETTSDKTLETALQFAELLLENGDDQRAIHVINYLERYRPDDVRNLMLRGSAYEKMNWTSAMLDELRTFVRLHPSNQTFRAGLAFELVYSLVPSLRNPLEASELISKRRGSLESEPFAAKLMASTEAKLGNFDNAVAMQELYLESAALNEADREAQEDLLALYKKRMAATSRPLPTFDTKELLSQEQLANVARNCMVIVRVMGTFECRESTTGETKVLGLSHDHIGTVLDTFGTLLVASETVRLPRYDDVTLLEGTGTTRWVQAPSLEVFSLPVANGESISLGQAVLVGSDEEAGLAVIKLSRDKPFTFINMAAGYQSVKFEPEYRPFDKNSDLYLKKAFELTVDAIGSGILPAINEVKLGENRVSAYIQWTNKKMTLTRSAYVNDSKGPIGTPVFNQLGECVGIQQKVGIDPKRLRAVAVPASTCTRIASKLASVGHVERAELPIVVGGMFTDVSQPSSGMLVMELENDDSISQPLKGRYITSLDGVQTNSLTEWLAASERIASMGLETAVVEVFDKSTKRVSLMTIPIGGMTKEPAPTGDPNPGISEKPLNSTKVVPRFLKVIEDHLATSVNQDALVYWDTLIEKAVRDQRNISFLFPGDMMTDGRPHAIILRDGEVVVKAVAPRAIKLDMNAPGKVRVIEFGNIHIQPKKAADFQLTNVNFIRSKSTMPQDEIVADIEIRGLQIPRDHLFVRFQFVGTTMGFIHVSLKDIPNPGTNLTVRISSELDDMVRPKPWGGLCVVDIIQMPNPYALNDVRSVSNQWVDYVELTEPSVTEELIDLDFAEAMMEIYKK